MTGARCWVRRLMTICVIGLISGSLSAQELSGRVAGAVPLQNSSSSASPSSLANALDLFTGVNTKGPFTLSWKPVAVASERISVDGIPMQRGLDYDIDYTTALLAFREPVGGGRPIRVEYGYDPSNASQTKQALSLPLSLDLVRTGSSGLQLVGLYKQSATGTQAASDTAVYGFAGTTASNSGSVQSTLLFNPDSSGQRNGDQTAFQFAGSTGSEIFRLSASYAHVGENFVASQEYKLQRGSDAMDIVLAFNPSSALSVSSTVKRSGFSFGEKAGHLDASAVHSLTFDQQGAPKFTMSRTEIEKEKPGAVGQKTTTDKAVIQHSIGDQLSASASYENISTVAGTAETRSKTNQMGVDYKVSSDVSLAARFVEKDTTKAGRESNVGLTAGAKLAGNLSASAAISRSNSDRIGPVSTEVLRLKGAANDLFGYEVFAGHKDSQVTGDEFSHGVSVAASPLKSVNVKAAMSRADAEKTGVTNMQSLSLAANPSQLLDIEMNVAHKVTSLIGDESSHSVKLASAVRADTRLQLALTGRSVSGVGDESVRTAGVTTTVLPNASLRLEWTGKESDVKGSEEIAGLRVEAAPSNTVKVSGGLLQKLTEDVRDVTREARVELSPYEHTKIAGGLAETESNGAVVKRVTEFSASTKPTSYLEFMGVYKAREALDRDSLDSYDIALLLDTGGLFKLTGAYATNPEDKKGNVQNLHARSIGLKSDLGRFRFKGAYTMKDQYLVGSRSDMVEVGLDYSFSAGGLLTTTYTRDEKTDSSILGKEVYALGFTHRVGSSLNLYLGGRMTTYDMNHVLIEPREYDAEARVGVKF